MFLEIAKKRGTDQGIPQPLSWETLAAYQEVKGLRISSVELRLLEVCDEVFLRKTMERLKEKPDDGPG